MFKIDTLKKKAVQFHFVFSLLLTALLASWILWRWFPAPFSFAAGALTGLLIVISVDLCLGPLLTFLLVHSKKSKRELIVDGALIAILQFSALSYGLWQVYLARPAAVVFWQDGFYVVKAASFIQRYGEVPDLRTYSQDLVPLVYALKPVTTEDLRNFEKSLRDGVVPFEQISLYRPLQEGLAEIKQSPVEVQKLLKRYPELTTQLGELGDISAQQQFIYSPLRSEYGMYLIVLNTNAQLLGVIELSD